MNDTELLENGYAQFKPSSFDEEGVETCFQKRITDKVGKKYFITVNKYNLDIHLPDGKISGPSYEFTVYFTNKANNCPVRILFYAGWSIKEAEDIAEKLWQTGLWNYYETWEEN